MNSILIVTNSRSGGGAERSMNILAQSFHEIGLNVHLISVNAGDFDLIRPKCIDINLDRSSTAGFLETLEIALKLRSLVVKYTPDAILLNCDLPELLGLLTPLRKKIFIIEHTSVPFFNRRKLGFFIRWCHRLRGSSFVAISLDSTIWPFRRPPHFIVKNSMSPELVRLGVSQDKSTLVNGPRLIFIGRLSKEKAPNIFVEIVRSSGLAGIMFGDGPMMQEIHSDPPPNLEIRGYVANPWSEISINDILIVTSEFEGDGLVVVEGIMNCIPILLRDVVDLRRFELSDGNYATDVKDFCSQISCYLAGQVDLVPPEVTRLKILESRNPMTVALSWKFEIEHAMNSLN